MHPVLFEIPGIGFPIRSFGVLVAVGIFLAIWIWGKLLARYGDEPAKDPARGSQVALWVIIGVLAGARLMYVGVEVSRYLGADLSKDQVTWLDRRATDTLSGLGSEKLEEAERKEASTVAVGHAFLRDPVRILFLWQGGLVMYGGLLGGILLGALSAKHYGLVLWNAFDTALVPSFVGLAIGRWGCLLVGDDYGRIVPEAYRHLRFPITLRVPPVEWLDTHRESLFDRALAGELIWCTQVWMSVNALLIALVGWLLLRRRKRYGTPGLVMLVIYACTRSAIEEARGDEIRGLWFDGAVSTSQLVSIAIGLVALVLLVRRPGQLTPRASVIARRWGEG